MAGHRTLQPAPHAERDTVTASENHATNEELLAFLEEQLPSERMAAIEAAMRDDEELRDRLAVVVARHDPGAHSVGAIWRRRRLSCPSRSELGSFVLGAAEATRAEYIAFHLEVIGCRYCAANLADLEQASGEQGEEVSRRRQKFFQSSAGYLSGEAE